MSYSNEINENPYASYRLNPDNFTGQNRIFAEKHNSNINNNSRNSSKQSYSDNQHYSGTITSSGVYMTHSYYGNGGSVIRSCVE